MGNVHARKLVAVSALVVSMVGIGGAYSAAFADTNTDIGNGLVTSNPCPTGWNGAEVGIDRHDVAACTDLLP